MTKPFGLKYVREKITTIWNNNPLIFTTPRIKFILSQFDADNLFKIKIISKLNLILEISEYIETCSKRT